MAWQTPKTNWTSGDVPVADDFNRIERNIQELQDTKETPAGAQVKANAALNSAKQYTDQALDAHKTATNPHGVTKSQIGLGNVQNYGIATKAQAEAGTVNTAYMTPLRVKEAINSLAPISKLVTGSISINADDYTYLDLGFLPKILYITPGGITNGNCFYYNGTVFSPTGYERLIVDVTGTTFCLAKGFGVLHYWAIG